MLLCLVATIHCALGAALGIAHLILVVTFRCYVMVFGSFLMIARSLFMETATFFVI